MIDYSESIILLFLDRVYQKIHGFTKIKLILLTLPKNNINDKTTSRTLCSKPLNSISKNPQKLNCII